MARGGERERRRTATPRGSAPPSSRRPDRTGAGAGSGAATVALYDWVQEELDDRLARAPEADAPDGSDEPTATTAQTAEVDTVELDRSVEVAPAVETEAPADDAEALAPVAEPEAEEGEDAPEAEVATATDEPSSDCDSDSEADADPDAAPIDARRARRARRWHRVRQVAAVAVLAGVVAVPVTLRFQLDDERDRLARAEQLASGARTAQLGVEAEVAADAADLTNREVEAVAAARLAREARARLAASGVSEAALFETLDATEREVQGVEALRLAVADAIARQDRLLPEARGCIDEAIRALGRSAIAVATGRGSLTGSGSSCSAMGPGR